MNIKTLIFDFLFKHEKNLISTMEKQIKNLETELSTLYPELQEKVKRLSTENKKLHEKNRYLDGEYMLMKTKMEMAKAKPSKETKKTDKDQQKLKQWSDRVKKAGEYKCDVCRSVENLTAHHLWDKSNHPSLMYQDENGVCLCRQCHDEFHTKHIGTHCSPSLYVKFKTFKQALKRI